jgi:hypothetical protein
MSDATTEKTPFTAEEDARITAHVRARGMTFEVFLPERLADWLWQKLEAGVYKDPKEAAFIAFQDLMELDRHPAVRAQLLEAMLSAAASLWRCFFPPRRPIHGPALPSRNGARNITPSCVSTRAPNRRRPGPGHETSVASK